MKTEKIYAQHSENTEWMNNLLFYRDEIKIMKNRLQEVVSKNNSKEILALVEHFQNQIIVQSEQLDTIKHEINLDNDLIAKEVDKNKTAVDRRSLQDHTDLRKKAEDFEKIFTSFRTELNGFLSKHL